MTPAVRQKKPHGQMRQSQLITTFGPGAMVDLPNNSVLIGGLEGWTDQGEDIDEQRLVAKLEAALGVQHLRLKAPPIDTGDPLGPRTGIFVWEFPEWFVAQYQDERRAREGFRSRPLVHHQNVSRGNYYGPDKRRHPVVPIRFVQGCINGHLSDIDWYGFVHPKGDGCRRPLWLDERGTSGEFVDVFVRCECGKAKSLATATFQPGSETLPLGFCKGRRPWLGNNSYEVCGGDNGKAQPNRLLVRSASNSYFPQLMSVISIPDSDTALRAAIAEVYEEFLQYAESSEDVARERRKARVASALSGITDEVAWAEVQRRKAGTRPQQKSVKLAEVEMLLASPTESGEDLPGGVYYARSVPVASGSKYAGALDRVVRVDRLREVTAQVGFTRFESTSPEADGELNLEVRRASLASEVTWLPAIENRGEGFFLSFQKDAIDAWLARPAVKARGDQFVAAFEAWKTNHGHASHRFPGLPYVFLHSLSHLLIQAVSLECGYSATSIRERIYALGEHFGILLHTGTADAEGTLGGLVQVARRIDRHLDHAIELSRLCSNDPVCAQHPPDHMQEERFVHGAACHGCLLVAEPSCERRNEFLDRALVAATVADIGAEFFAESNA
jgi:hypothetical protein